MHFQINLLKINLLQTVGILQCIIQSDKISTDKTKEDALEIIVEVITNFPKFSAKQDGLTEIVYKTIFSYMIASTAEAEDEWLRPIKTVDKEGSLDQSTIFFMNLLNKIIPSLGQEKTLPLLSSLLQDMVEKNDWRYKYSALMALSQVAEYITNINEMDPIVEFTLRFRKDKNPKVRYAAFHCIGQFSDDKRFDFQQRFGGTMVPALIDAFDDDTPRVLAHVLAALTNFLEGSNKSGVDGYIASILEPCLILIDTGISLVKESAISAIAALAEASRGDFVPYWQKTADIICNVLKNVNQCEYKQLRGQAIECLTIMGEAVGKDEFGKTAEEIIKAMVAIQQNHVDEIDPQTGYLFAGWHRLSALFKDEFVPYLKEVLPSVMDLMSKTIQKYDQGEREKDESKKVKEDEVISGIKMLDNFLKDSKEGCFSDLENISQIFIHTLVKSKGSKLKVTASKTLSNVILALKQAENALTKIPVAANAYLNVLWDLYAQEQDLTNMTAYIESMKSIIEAAGRSMDQRQLQVLNENTISIIFESEDRKSRCNEELSTDEIDEDQLQKLQEEIVREEKLQCATAEMINSLFLTHQKLMIPFVDFLSKQFLPKYLEPTASPKMQKFGLTLLIGIVINLNKLIPEDINSFLLTLFKFTSSPHAEVREAVYHGLSVIIESNIKEFKPMVQGCYKAIIISLQIKLKPEEDQRNFWKARVRTVLTLGKIIMHQSENINVKEAVFIWVRQLPLAYYTDEAKLQHDMLLDIIETDPEVVFGKNGQELPRVVKVFAQLVNSRLVSAAFLPKMKKVIFALAEKEETKALLQEAIEKLDANLQTQLQKAVESEN